MCDFWPAAAAATIAVAALAGCGASASGSGTAQQHASVTVTPTRATFDVPLMLRATGLPSNTRATVVFSGTTATLRKLSGTIQAHTDARGDLELRNVFPYARMHVPISDFGPWPKHMEVKVSAGTTEAVTRVTRLPLRSVRITTTDERPAHAGFYGEWFLRPGIHHHTAVLIFGGSEGGLTQQFVAETLVAHGYPVLELAYFSEPGLPQTLTRIPLEYFERALVWMTKQPQVDPKKIVTWGASRGGEASMILAATFPRLVHGAVGYVPSAYVNPSPYQNAPAWTYRGKPLHEYVIPVWKSSGPIFVVGGYGDRLWPSGNSVTQIHAEMVEHGRRHDVTALTYQHAGHELATAIPLQFVASAAGYGIVHSRYGVEDLGGSPGADEAAAEDSWPRVLRFLARL